MEAYENNPITVEAHDQVEEQAPVEAPVEAPAQASVEAPVEEPGPAPVRLAAAPSEPEEPLTLVKFTKPYMFEQKVYKEVELSGLETMSASDMCAAEKHLNRSGMFSPLPEMTAEYVSFIAAQTSGLPIEFFKALPPRDFIRVKNKVTNFFYGEE